MEPANSGPSQCSIHDLQADLLGHTFSHLLGTGPELLSTVPLVCKRWRQAALDYPALWTNAEFLLQLDGVGVQRFAGFRRWLSSRAQHVRSLHFCTMGTGVGAQEEDHTAQAWGLLQDALEELAPSLQKLDLQWFGRLGSMRWLLPLTALQKLDLDAHALNLDVPLAGLRQLSRLTLYSVEGSVLFADLPDLLPPSLCCLSILHATPLRLPGCLARLPALERVFLSECELVEGGEPGAGLLDPLLQASSLQHLALHRSVLPRLPTELSLLTNLRALLLDKNTHPAAEEALCEILAPLRRLQILGVSNCKLRSLPPSVCGLSSLRCLYSEENRLGELPEGPYLRGLQILSLDWRTLLGGQGTRLLASAPALRHLYVCKAFPYLAPPTDTSRQAALAAVADAMAVHPALRRVVFVLYESERLTQQVEITRLMLSMAQRCPRLQLEALRYDHFFAASLDTLEAEVEAGAEPAPHPAHGAAHAPRFPGLLPG